MAGYYQQSPLRQAGGLGAPQQQLGLGLQQQQAVQQPLGLGQQPQLGLGGGLQQQGLGLQGQQRVGLGLGQQQVQQPLGLGGLGQQQRPALGLASPLGQQQRPLGAVGQQPLGLGQQQQQQQLGSPLGLGGQVPAVRQKVQFNTPPGDMAIAHNPPADCISSLAWSPSTGTQDLLAASTWDGKATVWSVQSNQTQAQATFAQEIVHEAPVLDVAFSADSSVLFSGGCDSKVKMTVVGQQGSQDIGAHDAPVKCVNYVDSQNVVASGSWDKTLRFWDTRSPQAVLQHQLSERVYAMDAKSNLLVVGTADRAVIAFDTRTLQQPLRTFTSPLDYQTRCISVFPDNRGFAMASIEGRCGIHHVNANEDNLNFAFKCHRDGPREQDVHGVNSVDFHPVHHTLATAGANGTFTFWDKDNKQKLKHLPERQTIGGPIAAAKFNSRGNIYAYAISYEWGQGADNYNASIPHEIFLHITPDTEIAKRRQNNNRRR